jgi:GTPase SAR1 family protein
MTKKIEPIYPIETLARGIDESIDREYKELKENIRSWLEVYYRCMNEALIKLDKQTSDAWEYALAVLREGPQTQDAILNLINKVQSPRGHSFDKELARAQVEFERELVRQVNELVTELVAYKIDYEKTRKMK